MEGRVAPAATSLSPVARDYPSRARVDLFQAAALRLHVYFLIGFSILCQARNSNTILSFISVKTDLKHYRF
jgi:hypothetical protein